LDAKHFRQRAERAREMARSGDDPGLARMLIEVAIEMEAEADAIETTARMAAQKGKQTESRLP